MTSCERCLCAALLLWAALFLAPTAQGVSGEAVAARGSVRAQTRLEPRVVRDVERDTAQIVAGRFATDATQSLTEAATRFTAAAIFSGLVVGFGESPT